ncbi:MAG: acetate kinase [Prevotellaceae bacterium]|jgi:acetate kinase|nr:acetate kinase [Prevotellaceae bacterium]
MNVLVLNCGSSSIKYQLLSISGDSRDVLAKGIVERVGLPEGVLIHKPAGQDTFELGRTFSGHEDGINAILAALTDAKHGVIADIHRIDAVGHRVAHGGEYFYGSVLIDEQTKINIEKCSDLAPLHNPANLKGIVSMERLLPGTPQVAVFDTSFHQTIPEKAYLYGIPYEYYQEYKIRRYGFHGTSHKFVAEKACHLAGLDINNSRIVTCHMGNGVSVTAIKDGKSIDTSMGFTPLEGSVMGTRSGDIDAGIVTYLQEKKHLSAAEINSLLNKDCGLAGISGISSDMRDLWAKYKKAGNQRAKLAIDIFIYRIAKYIGAYAVAMNGLDMVVYTGGIGENDWDVRLGISEYLGFLGAEIDKAVNDNLRTDRVISTPASKIKLVLAETNEELVIATDTVNIITKNKLK